LPFLAFPCSALFPQSIEGKGNDTKYEQNWEAIMKRRYLLLLFLLVLVTSIVGGTFFWNHYPNGFSLQSPASRAYTYYTVKDSRGFVLARALRGENGQPVGHLQTLLPLGDGFGLSGSDAVISLQVSPDGQYLAIDGNRDHGEQVWMYDIQQSHISLLPAAVSGNFLRWLPGGNGHTFLYRPMSPMGPTAPLDNGTWNPGLWIVDSASGVQKNISLGVPSADIVDAVPSPDGSRIVYSLSAGLGQGSETYLMNSDGSARSLLFNATGLESIAGLFTWSPDGTRIAYERLEDSPAPFRPAGLWTMNSQGSQQQRLADVDGGHGYMPAWSPDGQKLAFVVRTNSSDRQADTQMQALQSAIGVYNFQNSQSHIVASSAQTGFPLNSNPTWSANSAQVIFTALNPINRDLGGSPRYWSASVNGPSGEAQVVPLTPAISHVVAWE
jgi:Tol biopolymer transport system component